MEKMGYPYSNKKRKDHFATFLKLNKGGLTL